MVAGRIGLARRIVIDAGRELGAECAPSDVRRRAAVDEK